MHYYQHNIADYRKDTAHLTLLEHGCYHQLLDQYYLNEEPLPLDDNKLFRLLTARTQDEKNAIKSVLDDFFTKTENGYVHRRCQAEIEQYHLRVEVATSNAKRRWDAKAMPTQCQPNANPMLTNNHKPITNNHKPLTNINTISDFNLFWDHYPKKVGKESARKAWYKTEPDITLVLKTLEWQKVSAQWFEKGGQFIPNPATWINQHRWDDKPPEQITF